MAQPQRAQTLPKGEPDQRTAAFLAELTEISQKFGIGIAGDPVLFLLENQDRQFAYRIDDESNLFLG